MKKEKKKPCSITVTEEVHNRITKEAGRRQDKEGKKISMGKIVDEKTKTLGKSK